MLVRLEIFWDKKTGKQGFVIVRGGSEVKRDVVKSLSGDKKTCILDELKRGLANVRGVVSHEDVLSVVLQDKSMTKWFYTYKTEYKYKDYIETMDKISDTIEELDCKYRFVCLDSYTAKRVVPLAEIEEEKKIGISVLEGMPDEYDVLGKSRKLPS